MNRQISRLGAFLIVAFCVLFAQLNYLTIVHSEKLEKNPNNTRKLVRDFNQARGAIVTADGTIVAESVASKKGDPFKYQRRYPEGELFAHVTGYFSLNLGSTGVEREYTDELAGKTFDLEYRGLGDLFVDRNRTGTVELTLRKKVQQAAKDALGLQRGSVVALDPRSGGILAMWTYPSYDPNALAVHNTENALAARRLLLAAPSKPLLEKSYRERYPPGSTMKLVTGSAGVDSGKVTPTSPRYPVQRSYRPPLTLRPIRNFGGSACGGTLFPILAASCNSAFAQMGVELGPDTMVSTAERFRFNRGIGIDLPAAARSVFPTDFERNTPALAQSAIGQNDVAATPLEMALVAATIANKGVMMTPHVMKRITDNDGNEVDRYKPHQLGRVIKGSSAQVMHDAMLGVVEHGTAARLAPIDGMVIGGKTGTAQVGSDPPSSHAWIVAFAGPPGQAPQVVVAVIVEAQPGVSEVTGGRVAAPIAKQVLEAALGVQ